MANRNAEVNDPKRLEAEIRAAMWHHSQIRPDGYDPKHPRRDRMAARLRIRNEIDALLDERSVSLLLIALEDAS